MSDNRPGPLYRGTHKHTDQEGGYAIRIPSDWEISEMADDRHGFIYMPDRTQPATFLSTETVALDFAVTEEDVPVLREGFEAGLNSLPDIVIESLDQSIKASLQRFEAKLTFAENGQTRKRWLRLNYWQGGLLVAIAQGATPEAYEYWLPMFFNSMMTVQIGL